MAAIGGRVAARLDEIRWVHTSGPYQALDLTFGIRTCDRSLGERLAAALAVFSVDGPLEGLFWFSALERRIGGQSRQVAYRGGRRLTVTPDCSQVAAFVLWAFNQDVISGARGALLIHGAAAERDGVVVVLPAAPNSGKTTLVAGLLRRGYSYITDEVFAVDIASGSVRPFPKALSLDPGSWPLFPEAAPLDGLSAPQWHVPASRLGAGVSTVDSGPMVLLSPRYQPDASTVLTRLTRPEGLVLLAENSFNAGDWGAAGLGTAATIVRRCSVIGMLTSGDLNSALDAVDNSVEEALEQSKGEA